MPILAFALAMPVVRTKRLILAFSTNEERYQAAAENSARSVMGQDLLRQVTGVRIRAISQCPHLAHFACISPHSRLGKLTIRQFGQRDIAPFAWRTATSLNSNL